MSGARAWLVTGASSGFGRAMTEHLLKIGNKVIATLRKPDALSDLTARYPPSQLLVVQVDVTNPSDVAAAFAKAEEAFGRIDVVFNNAGVYVMAEIESTDEPAARDVFEVNFWGATHVTREAVRFFREVNRPVGGRLLQVSSRVGLVGAAACGYYSASKFALEGFSECLASELEPAWNIKVTLLEPGPYRTEIFGKNYQHVPQHPAYADPAGAASRSRKHMTSPATWDGDVAKAAVAIEMFSRGDDAPMRFPLHGRVLDAMRGKAGTLLEAADTYESWTRDLYHET